MSTYWVCIFLLFFFYQRFFLSYFIAQHKDKYIAKCRTQFLDCSYIPRVHTTCNHYICHFWPCILNIWVISFLKAYFYIQWRGERVGDTWQSLVEFYVKYAYHFIRDGLLKVVLLTYLEIEEERLREHNGYLKCWLEKNEIAHFNIRFQWL